MHSFDRGLGMVTSSALAMVLVMAGPAAAQTACKGDNGGLALSPGFCATVFADNLGHVRHLAVAPDGTVYANTWSGRYFRNGPAAPPGAFLVALKDADGDGRAEIVQRFGPRPEDGGAGGSGIAFYGNAVYAEEKDRILQYARAPGEKCARCWKVLPEVGSSAKHSTLCLRCDDAVESGLVGAPA